MNVVFFSPHFPPNFYRFCIGLRAVGATVLGIGDAPMEELRPDMREAMDDYYRVDDLHRYSDLVRAMGWFTHRHGKIDRIDSLNEYWLATEAALRTDFNILGMTPAEVHRLRQKSEMKRLFRKAGVAVPQGLVCHTPAQIRAFIREVGYPVVAKPNAGVGAARTYRIATDDDLAAYLAEKPDDDYMVEEFIDGRLVSYDGLADRDGQVVFSSSIVYSTGVMEAVMGADIHYHVPRVIPADLEEVGRAVVAAFHVRERAFHFEFFRLADGTLTALEVNLRPPGGPTVDMWNFANDFDFYREWANIVVHGRFESTITRPFNCLFAGRKQGRAYRLSHGEVLDLTDELLVHHQPIPGVFSAAMGDYGYIMRSAQLEPLIAAADTIQAVA